MAFKCKNEYGKLTDTVDNRVAKIGLIKLYLIFNRTLYALLLYLDKRDIVETKVFCYPEIVLLQKL